MSALLIWRPTSACKILRYSSAGTKCRMLVHRCWPTRYMAWSSLIGKTLTMPGLLAILVVIPPLFCWALRLGLKAGASWRLEESGVGQECVSWCRDRWSTDYAKKKNTQD